MFRKLANLKGIGLETNPTIANKKKKKICCTKSHKTVNTQTPTNSKMT